MNFVALNLILVYDNFQLILEIREIIMANRIAFFNHKGGVSKTTTTFHLGWMLASKGKRVIMVDADPQCNLTGMVMGFENSEALEEFYTKYPMRNIKAGLAPAFEARPKLIESIECYSVEPRPDLFLLPGNIRMAEYEVTLGIAQELSSSIHTLQNLPGSLTELLDITAKAYNADYILIDMSPSLSAINQNLLMTSEYFIVPTAPDYFSIMAIDSLEATLPRWHKWSEIARDLEVLKNANYPFPSKDPKFLGYIVQKFTTRKGEPSRGFKDWVEVLGKSIENKLIPVLEKNQMLLTSQAYSQLNYPYRLAQIPDFQGLITASQKHNTPVYALSKEQLNYSGVVLDNYQEKQDELKTLFSDLADKIINMTETENERSY